MLFDLLVGLDSTTIMKGTLLFLLVGIVSILHLDAFLPAERRRCQYHQPSRLFGGGGVGQKDLLKEKLGHEDIVWKVRPPPDVPRLKRLWLRLAANLIRLDSIIRREEPPLVLCPKGGLAVLEAHHRPSPSSRYEKIARFGFTTERGPPIPLIRESVNGIYGVNQELMVGVGAVIYMFVEEPYRKKDVGALALDVISLIHIIQGCDFTVLVADDDGSGKLVKWYEQHGFTKAPKLQECFGSPDGIHGLTMISPTRRTLPDDCFIKWW
jgi:hypothetical protein